MTHTLNDQQVETGDNFDVQSKIITAANILAAGDLNWSIGFDKLKLLIAEMTTTDLLNDRGHDGLRAIDILVRGKDSQETAYIIELMADSGYAEEMLIKPNASEMSPMMAACYFGNPIIVARFLELGMPIDIKTDAPRQKILNGTAYHAVISGYRESRKEDYLSVVNLLLSYYPDGIDIPDRMRQKPVDMAVKAAASTGDRSLLNKLLNFGVELKNAESGFSSAKNMMESMMKSDSSSGDTARSMLASNEARLAVREINSLKARMTP